MSNNYPNNGTIDLGPLPRDSWKDPARTDRTVAAMTAVIHSTDRTGWVRTLAHKIGAEPQPATEADNPAVLDYWRNRPAIALAPLKIYFFLRARLDFARDPDGIELVRHPDRMIAEYERTGRMHGDCDDLACLGAALVRAAGFRAALIVAGRRAQGPFEHVYYGAFIPTLPNPADGPPLVPFDPQEKIPPGRERAVERRKVYTV